MDWNTVTVWTDAIVEQYLDEHPRNDGNRALAREILEADLEKDADCIRTH